MSAWINLNLLANLIPLTSEWWLTPNCLQRLILLIFLMLQEFLNIAVFYFWRALMAAWQVVWQLFQRAFMASWQVEWQSLNVGKMMLELSFLRDKLAGLLIALLVGTSFAHKSGASKDDHWWLLEVVWRGVCVKGILKAKRYLDGLNERWDWERGGGRWPKKIMQLEVKFHTLPVIEGPWRMRKAGLRPNLALLHEGFLKPRGSDLPSQPWMPHYIACSVSYKRLTARLYIWL